FRRVLFRSYEAGRRRVSNISNVLVPTPAERNGDFSDWRDADGNLVPIYDPTTEVGGNPATRTPFPNNQIPSGSISGIAANYMNLLPLPNVPVANMAACAQTNGNGSGACTNFVTSLSQPYDTDNHTFRLDENVSDKDRIY